jgi:hypothetical protein
MERWSQERRWALSALAALVVAAMLLAGWWLGGSGGSDDRGAGAPASKGSVDGADTGPGMPGPSDTGPGGGAQHPPTPQRSRPVKGAVRIDSYVAAGDRLLVNYAHGVPECYGEVMLGSLREGPRSVVVTLRAIRRVEVAEAERCIDLAVTGTVTVELSAPLGQRSVLDGGFQPAVLVRDVSHPAPPTDCWPHIEPDDPAAATS